tara:strand:+ start:3904 stop:4368 length:465 start_codon:yes stop_codon:yes gene_type:complete
MLKDLLAMSFLIGLTTCATHEYTMHYYVEKPLPTHRQFFTALAEFESGTADNAIGDYGASIGRYQIGGAYHADALEFSPSIGGVYQDVTRPDYAEKIITAYMLRYLGADVWNNLTDANIQLIARTHNGGPRGASKQSTKEFGVAILNLIKKENE